MQKPPKSSNGSTGVWLDRDSGSIAQFEAMIAARVDPADWPLCNSVQDNILIYDGDAVREAAGDPDARRALMAEWCNALMSGPGVFAIQRAMPDGNVVDRASGIFETLIAEQSGAQSGGEDHFAKPGANDRVWNALQKHCLADPENFIHYFGNQTIDLACRAWLGDGYQMTAQVNRVNPGGEGQVAHRDYHLGFMPPERMVKYPAHVHALSPVLTLQGAIAHCDMPLETGPTRLLPFSQKFAAGYLAFGREAFQACFAANAVQVPLKKGDAMFFNPALMHGAGTNRTVDVFRTANLLQVSSAFGRAMETVDRLAMVLAIYPALLAGRKSGDMSRSQMQCALAASAEGYAFPTNLDQDPPIGGLSPQTQFELTVEALDACLPLAEFEKILNETTNRRQA